MTKAERIFKDTRYECRKSIERCGYEVNPSGKAIGYNRVASRDDESVCNRTLNDMMKFLRSDRKLNEMSLKYGVIDQSKYEERMKVLNMVEITIENHRKAIGC